MKLNVTYGTNIEGGKENGRKRYFINFTGEPKNNFFYFEAV